MRACSDDASYSPQTRYVWRGAYVLGVSSGMLEGFGKTVQIDAEICVLMGSWAVEDVELFDDLRCDPPADADPSPAEHARVFSEAAAAEARRKELDEPEPRCLLCVVVDAETLAGEARAMHLHRRVELAFPQA